MKKPIYISNENGENQLIVDGKAWFAFAGEVHNSSCSTIEYYKSHVLDGVEQLNINTIILPVYWEDIEPEEGRFNFNTFDSIIKETRQKGLRVVLLWFGLWKNGLSTYVPQWIKLDREKYPFVKAKDVSLLYSVTPLSAAAIESDSKAFETLMEHIKEIDAEHQTVLMVQVENEVGTLKSDRDYDDIANTLFNADIPEGIARFVQKRGTWETCFGEEAAETFMCYYYAKAVEKIAARGKAKYALPLVVNAWLIDKDQKPGDYPSGGPVQNKVDLWRFAAPSIDLCVPDIYLDNYREICDIYAKQGLLFVPETRQDVSSVSHVIYTFAHYPSAGFSPFGIEDFLPDNAEKLAENSIFKILNIAMEAFVPDGSGSFISKLYGDLASVTDLMMQKRPLGKVHAFMQDNNEEGTGFPINALLAKIMFLKGENVPRSAGFIMELQENEFLIYGIQFLLQLESLLPELQYGVLHLEEGNYKEGQWVCNRILNGDEQYVITESTSPKFYRLKYHLFQR